MFPDKLLLASSVLFFNQYYISPIDAGILQLGNMETGKDLLVLRNTKCTDEVLIACLSKILVDGISSYRIKNYRYSPLGDYDWWLDSDGPLSVTISATDKYFPTVKHRFHYSGKALISIIRWFYKIS